MARSIRLVIKKPIGTTTTTTIIAKTNQAANFKPIFLVVSFFCKGFRANAKRAPTTMATKKEAAILKAITRTKTKRTIKVDLEITVSFLGIIKMLIDDLSCRD